MAARDGVKRRAGARSRGRSGAQALVEQLEASGVEVVFGIPGVHNLAIFEALRGSQIEVVLVRHEQTAAYAADGYARATGRLGVCVTTTGPGAANTAAAMGEARASRSPVLHISTQIESRLLQGRGGRWSLHESPAQRALMDAVSIWSGGVARAEAIPSMLQRASVEAFSGRRGPVFVEIPHDLLAEPVAWEPGPAIEPPRRAPAPTAIERAAACLREAKRPAMWVGGGAIAADAADAVAAVAEALQAPVVTTFAAKGVLPPEHPLLVGFPPHHPEVTRLLSGSDALLVVGSDLDGMNTQGWRLPLPRPRVSINTVAEDARRNYAADVVVEADARDALEVLVPMLGTTRRDGARRVARVREVAEAALGENEGFARAYRFIRRLEAAVPGEAVVLADMAIPGYWAAAYWRAPRPRSFCYPLGWGTLGFALPAAIGAASSGRSALVIAGDAGFLYGAGELATAVQQRLPVVVLVVDDGGYGMLRFDERERFGRTLASDLRSPDFVALARSFGVRAERVTLRSAPSAVASALQGREPVLLELQTRFEPPLTTSPRWPLKGKPEARP